jgi:GGDEF domain-containing protein
VPALITAVIFSRRFGFFSILLAVLAAAGASFFNNNTIASFFHYNLIIIIAATSALVYIFGTIRVMDRTKTDQIKKRFRNVVKENYRLKRITSAQIEVNRELEERLTRQRFTISTLHNQMHRMDSLNLGKSLDILIETIVMFTEAEALTIWTQSTAAEFLHPAAAKHKDGAFDSSELLNIEGSIEGWVYRNNRSVSARMIDNYEHLKRMNTGRNLITMPIAFNKKVWGVLNIEEMPFVKYNQYTEKLLEIIISLSKPILSRAVDYEKQIQQSETDKDTGLPLFSQLYNMLNRYISASGEDDARISLLIIEMQNYYELIKQFPSKSIKGFFKDLINEIQLSASGMAEFFMHKDDSQMAVLIPGLDSDGASLICLEILEQINTTVWLVDSTEVFIEMIIGYASLGENAQDAEGLINHAEHLLELQKL